MESDTTTSQTVNASQVPPSPVQSAEHQDGMTDDTKSAVVALLLVWFYPIGLIFMFIIWMKWPVWAKILILLPLLFSVLIFVLIFGAFGAIFSSALNSEGFLGNTIQCSQQCESAVDQEACMAECVELPENMDSTGSFDSDTQIPSGKSEQ